MLRKVKQVTDFIIAVAALIAILISLWSLFYSHRSANASEAAVREARRSADSAERAEGDAEASAQAASTSAAADATLARLAEEKREREQAPNLALSTTSNGGSGYFEVTIHNRGPQHWQFLLVTLMPRHGTLPPVTLEGDQEPFFIGSGLVQDGSFTMRVRVTKVDWSGTVHLAFKLMEHGSAEETLLERPLQLARGSM